MKKTILSILTFTFFAFAITACSQVRANYDSVKEDYGCCFPASVFCLSEKSGEDPSFHLSEEAKKDIGITEEQMTKLRELVKMTKTEIEKEMKDLKRPAKDADKKVCAEYRQKMKDICEKHYPQCMKKLEGILSKEQIEKINTRIFQYCGFAPNPIALAALDLTSAQKTKLAEICETACDKIHECTNDKTLSSTEQKEKLHQKVTECRKECTEKVKSILSKEQIAKGERLLNETPSYVKQMKERHNPTQTAAGQSGTTSR